MNSGPNSFYRGSTEENTTQGGGLVGFYKGVVAAGTKTTGNPDMKVRCVMDGN
jgi:hypothetical protein